MSILRASLGLASLLATTVLALPAQAQGVTVSGGVQVSGGVAVGVGYGPPPPYYPPAPQPVYYPPPQPVYYPPPPQPVYYPPPPAPIEPAPRLQLGVGLYLSSSAVGDTANSEDTELTAAGGGALLRLRLGDHFELEGLVGQDHFHETPRIDTRLGLAGLFNFGDPGGFRPFALLGVGVNVIQPLGNEVEYAEDTLPTQGYVEVGLGLSWEISDAFVLAGEWRAQARQLDEESRQRGYTTRGVGQAPADDDAGREVSSEVRLTGLVYF